MVTLERAKKHLNAWLDAELKVSNSQSYTLGPRTLTYANIAEIRKQIAYWENRVKALEMEAAGRKVNKSRRFMPRDL